MFNDGPVRYGSLFSGEVYDATKEVVITNWSARDLTIQNGKKAVAIPLKECLYWCIF
ncbi:MAG: hypothetical protein IPO04_10840 [Cytophagaceae bacterium]|nr:hypothetical protein [Cytophagaceae bacterium]